MKLRQAFFGAVGIAIASLGLALLFIPETETVGPIASLVETVESTGTTRVLVVTGLAITGYLLFGLRTPKTQTELSEPAQQFDRATEHQPGEVTTEHHRVAAARLDGDIEYAIEHGGKALSAVREQLCETAAVIYAEQMETTETQARRAIERGQWCQDQLVAAFLATNEGPKPTLGQQCRLLLFPKRERRRRIERTITAIEQLEQA